MWKPAMDSYKELSSQELELTRMFEELKQNRSLLQLLLQNCPDSVQRLLDRFTMNISHFPPVASWKMKTTLSTSTSFCSIDKLMITAS